MRYQARSWFREKPDALSSSGGFVRVFTNPATQAANRHCPTCGFERRDEWREGMIDWSLDCEYFHIVFTLPHTLWSADLRQCEASKNGLPFAQRR